MGERSEVSERSEVGRVRCEPSVPGACITHLAADHLPEAVTDGIHALTLARARQHAPAHRARDSGLPCHRTAGKGSRRAGADVLRAELDSLLRVCVRAHAAWRGVACCVVRGGGGGV